VNALAKLTFAALLSVSCFGGGGTVITNIEPPPPQPPPLPGPSPLRVDEMIIAHAGPVNWGPAAAALPSGARAVVLDGNPARPGVFTLRLLIPAGYVIPPHTHPSWEHMTVVSGTIHIGTGSTIEMENSQQLRAGSYIAIPAGLRHWLHSASESVIQLHGGGPWNISYVNRADDPRNR
jgi:quercetin dioxygenase-like cupin family protein